MLSLLNVGNNRQTDFAILFAAMAAVVLLTRAIPYDLSPFSGYDLAKYREMAFAASGISENVNAPFAHRPLGPWLVGITPLPVNTAFFVWSLLFQALSVVLMYTLLRAYVSNRAAVMVATIGFVLTKHLFIFIIFDYFMLKDAVGLSAMLGVLLLLKRGSPVSALALVAATVPFTEGILVAVPVVFAHTLNKERRFRALLPLIPISLGAFIVFAAIRILIDAPGPTLIDQLAESWTKLLSPYLMLKLLLNPFAPLILVPILYFRSAFRFLVKEPHMTVLILGVVGGSLFGKNLERLMLLAAPAFFLMIAFAISENLGQRKWIMVVLTATVILASQHHRHTVLPFPNEQLHTNLLVFLTSLVAAVALGYDWWRERLRTRLDTSLRSSASYASASQAV